MRLAEIHSEILKQVEHLWEEEVEFLQEIGRYPTVLGQEQALQNYLSEYFQSMELEVDQFVPDMKTLSDHPGFSIPEWSYDGRTVVVAKAPGADENKGKSLIYQGHIDVVSPEPVTSWAYDPWGSTVKNGKLYGRGMQDMKSGVAAMIFAYKAVRAAGYRPAADFMLQTVIEEECTGNGALAALEKGYTADAALIPEPFGLKAAKAQVGVIWMRVKVKGLGAHTERASEAVNAIEKIYSVVEALKQYRTYINEQPKHPDFADHPHPLNVNIGTIYGGHWPSNVPSEATLEARIGFYPGQDPNEVKRQVKVWLLEATAEDEWLKERPPEITFYGFHAEGFSLDEPSKLLQTLDRSHETVTNTPPERTVLTATTDARFFNLYYDIPCTCYGPVGGNMHGVDEWVDLNSVKEVTKVYADFLVNWCGVVKE